MRNQRWLWVAMLLVANGVARGADFADGTLIIPMDVCWQNIALAEAGYSSSPSGCTAARTNREQGGSGRSGITRAAGLVWRLVQAGIPVKVVRPDPTKRFQSDSDLSLRGVTMKNLLHPTNGSISEASISGSSFDYPGMPFIIDAIDRRRVEDVLRLDWRSQSVFSCSASYSSSDPNVIIHVLRTNVTGMSVALNTLTALPRIAVMDLPDESGSNIGLMADGHGHGYGPFEQMMCDAGFKEVAGSCGTYFESGMSDLGSSDSTYPDTTGTIFHRINRVSDFRDGVLTRGGYKLLYVPHWISWAPDTGSAMTTQNQRDVYGAISSFLNSGGAVVMSGKSIEGMEQAWKNSNSTGRDSKGANPRNVMTNQGLLKNQGASSFYGNGYWSGSNVSGQAWKFAMASPLAQIGDVLLRRGSSGGFYEFSATTGGYVNGVTRLVTMNTSNMDVLASRPYPNNGMLIYSTINRFNDSIAGDRLIMNSIMTLNNMVAPIELARSSPVVQDNLVYQGSYIQTASPQSAYPPVKGHFRKYDPSALSSANVTAFSAATAAWDASLSATRTIYTKDPSGTALISFDASTVSKVNLLRPVMNVGDNAATTTAINGIRAGALGGIDHSTPAFVGTSKVAPNGTTRTPIVLVGALDGMLHAFKVSDGTALWSYIPTSQIGRIGNYKAAVNGSPMVTDVYDHLRGWRTLAVITMGTMPEDELSSTAGHSYTDTTNGARGTVEILDITDTASPTLVAVGSDSTNGYVMGQALGASHGLIFNQGRRQDVIYVATNNQNSGAEVPGFNLYALKAEDGSVLWRGKSSYNNRLTNVAKAGGGYWPVPNGLPAVPVLINSAADGSYDDKVYLGDLAGDVWEFDARNGDARQLWPNPPAASGATVSPITTSLALFRNSYFEGLYGGYDLRLAFTRGAADFMADSTLSYLTVLALAPPTGTVSVLYNVQAVGANERYLGSVNIYKGDAYFMVSQGTLAGAIEASRNDSGVIRRVNLSSFATVDQTVKKGGTEVTVNADNSIIGTSAAGITQISGTANNTDANPVNSNFTKLNWRPTKPVAVRAWLDIR